jgi:hypothetical protein
MPTIDLPEKTYKRLQALATPFVDTPVSVVERALDALEALSPSNPPKPINSSSTRIFGPSEAPNLTDTRIVSALFDGVGLETTYWNELVRKVHELIFKRVGNFEALRRISTANIIEGSLTEKGYKPIEGIGFSIQGVDANEAWRITYHLARKLNVPLEIEFEWRTTERAERPGEAARLVWSPSTK